MITKYYFWSILLCVLCGISLLYEDSSVSLLKKYSMLILTHSSKKHLINSLLFFFLSFLGDGGIGAVFRTSHILGKCFPSPTILLHANRNYFFGNFVFYSLTEIKCQCVCMCVCVSLPTHKKREGSTFSLAGIVCALLMHY